MDFLILIFAFAVFGVPIFFIVKKAGFNPWLSLIAFIPIVNIVAFWVFAFSTWPNAAEARSGRQNQNSW